MRILFLEHIQYFIITIDTIEYLKLFIFNFVIFFSSFWNKKKKLIKIEKKSGNNF